MTTKTNNTITTTTTQTTTKLTTEQISEFTTAFHSFDKNNDGKISDTEFRKIMSSLYNSQQITDRQVKKVIAQYDKDGDGCIDLCEFLLMMATSTTMHISSGSSPKASSSSGSSPKKMRRKSTRDLDKDLRDVFNVFDANSDGLITAKELNIVFTKLGQQMTPQQVSDMIHLADVDKDGKINFSEFKVLYLQM